MVGLVPFITQGPVWFWVGGGSVTSPIVLSVLPLSWHPTIVTSKSVSAGCGDKVHILINALQLPFTRANNDGVPGPVTQGPATYNWILWKKGSRERQTVRESKELSRIG